MSSTKLRSSLRRLDTSNRLDSMHWNLIKQYFQGQWVELTDVEWDWDAQSKLKGPSAWHPKRARVRNFAPQRHELLRLLEKYGRALDSTIVYVSTARYHTRCVVEHVVEHAVEQNGSPASAA